MCETSAEKKSDKSKRLFSDMQASLEVEKNIYSKMANNSRINAFSL